MNDFSASSIAQQIDEKLRQIFAPDFLEIIDESHRHAGHAGHNGRGESHFSVTIVSRAFRHQDRVARHRMVYAALQPLLNQRIHALRLQVLAEDEVPKRNE